MVEYLRQLGVNEPLEQVGYQPDGPTSNRFAAWQGTQCGFQ
ncbi:MAG: hypothetical protein H6R26_3296 [Proteobacteria bacterium]|nr:hypothetical protein [Pseudomonadota bacterium]